MVVSLAPTASHQLALQGAHKKITALPGILSPLMAVPIIYLYLYRWLS